MQTALQCPRLFHYRYIDKLKEPETMPEARVGKAIHAALEQVLMGTGLIDAADEARRSLDTELELSRFDAIRANIQPFVDRIDSFRRRRRVLRQIIEFPLAIRENLTTTGFNAGDAFYRGILDVGYVFDEDNLALVDHKTGQRIGQQKIVDQLEGYAVLGSAYFRHVRRFWLGIHWVADSELEWAAPVQGSDVNRYFLPNVLGNIEAAALAVADGSRPNIGPWCERCSYRSVCPEGMEQRFEPVDDDDDSGDDGDD